MLNGETWKFSLTGIGQVTAVAPADGDGHGLASGFVSSINNHAGYTASVATNSNILVVQRATAFSSSTFTIDPAGAVQVDPNYYETRDVTLTPALHETGDWTITLRDHGTGAVIGAPFTYSQKDLDDPTAVASAFKGLIDGSLFHATNAAGVLTITRLSAGGLDVSSRSTRMPTSRRAPPARPRSRSRPRSARTRPSRRRSTARRPRRSAVRPTARRTRSAACSAASSRAAATRRGTRTAS